MPTCPVYGCHEAHSQRARMDDTAHRKLSTIMWGCEEFLMCPNTSFSCDIHRKLDSLIILMYWFVSFCKYMITKLQNKKTSVIQCIQTAICIHCVYISLINNFICGVFLEMRVANKFSIREEGEEGNPLSDTDARLSYYSLHSVSWYLNQYNSFIIHVFIHLTF